VKTTSGKIFPAGQKVGPAFDRKVGNGGATQNQIKIQNSPAVKAMNNTAVAAIVNNSSPTSAPVWSELVVIDLPRSNKLARRSSNCAGHCDNERNCGNDAANGHHELPPVIFTELKVNLVVSHDDALVELIAYDVPKDVSRRGVRRARATGNEMAS